MEYVDEINVANGGEGTHLYSTGATPIKKLCLENDLHLLDASVRHLGTDKNLVVLEHLYNILKDGVDISSIPRCGPWSAWTAGIGW